MGITVVSAHRGARKTTFVRAWVADLARRGRSIGGIASPAVFENGRRVGYDLIDLRHGSRRPLARLNAEPAIGPLVGRYRFDEAALEVGSAAIIAAVRDHRDVIAIDEIGPLEFRGQGWAPALELALKEHQPPQDLILVVRPALGNELPKRFPSPAWALATQLPYPWPELPRA